MTIGNIYAPNDDNVSFFEEVVMMLNSTSNETKIIGGDFNFALDLDKDKKGGQHSTHTKCVQFFQNYMKSSKLIDV